MTRSSMLSLIVSECIALRSLLRRDDRKKQGDRKEAGITERRLDDRKNAYSRSKKK